MFCLQTILILILLSSVHNHPTKPNASVRYRISAKVFDEFIAILRSNSGRLYSLPVSRDLRVETQIETLSYQLIPALNTVEVTGILSNLFVYDTQLHRLEGAQFKLALQLDKSDGSDINLGFSKCELRATEATVTQELVYIATLERMACQLLQTYLSHSLKMLQLIPMRGVDLSIYLVEPSAIYKDHIDLYIAKEMSSTDLATGEKTNWKQQYPLPDVADFDSSQAIVESVQSVEDSNFLCTKTPVVLGPLLVFQHSSYPASTRPIVNLLKQIQQELGEAVVEPIMFSLTAQLLQMQINETHVSMGVSTKQLVFVNSQNYFQEINPIESDLILKCNVDWHLEIHLTTTPKRWIDARDLQNANLTVEVINEEITQSRLGNNSVTAKKLCGQINEQFDLQRNMKESLRMVSSTVPLSLMKFLLLDSAMAIRLDVKDFVQNQLFAPIRPRGIDV